MNQNASETSALFARLEKTFRQTEALLVQLIKTYPLYSCQLPILYTRQIYQTELLLEIKNDFEKQTHPESGSPFPPHSSD